MVSGDDDAAEGNRSRGSWMEHIFQIEFRLGYKNDKICQFLKIQKNIKQLYNANLPSSTERPLGHHGRSCRVPAGPLILLHRQHKFNTAGSQRKFTQLHIRYYRHA